MRSDDLRIVYALASKRHGIIFGQPTSYDMRNLTTPMQRPRSTAFTGSFFGKICIKYLFVLLLVQVVEDATSHQQHF